MDPFSLDHIFSCSSHTAIRFARFGILRPMPPLSLPLRLSGAKAVTVPRDIRDRLHGSFFLTAPSHSFLQATAAFSLPSSCQRTLICIDLQCWWRYGDLNPRPMACKATALATELYPR